ncbi:MAG: hypothetical protein AAB176_12820 [Pseudomonadota bacterium]
MNRLDLAIADWGLSMGLPSLALDDQGCATLKIGDGMWTLQTVEEGQGLLLAHTMDVPFGTAQQMESALMACHAHMQPAHAPGTFRLGLSGRGAATQWSGCLRLTMPTDHRALAQGMDALIQWMADVARAAQVAGRH